MGSVVVKVEIANPRDPERRASVEVLVDTGAVYSMIPGEALRRMGVQPLVRKAFKTADGRSVERELADVLLAYDGELGVTRVIFGAPQDAAVLGLHALETLGLEVDPLNRELRPATLFLFFAGKKTKAAFEVGCPHCGAKLTVDAEMHAVLEHVPPPKKSDFDFDQQLKGMSEAERKREELFRQQMAAEKDRSKLLERKFEESFQKRKDEPVTKPLRDIDLD